MQLFTTFFLTAVIVEAREGRPDKRRVGMNDRNLDQGRRNLLTASNPDFGPNLEPLARPVPFGHIFREGFEDGEGAPIDLLELHTMYLKDGQYARDLIKHRRKKFQIVTKDGEFPREGVFVPPPLVPPPPIGDKKPEFGDQRLLVGDEVDNLSPDATPHLKTYDRSLRQENDTIVPLWNYEALLRRNIADPPKYRLGGGKRPSRVRPEMPQNYTRKYMQFARNSYDLVFDQPKRINMTTCEEFGKHSKFHPNDIVNIDWVPFYVWTDERDGKVAVSRIHHFKYPTKKLVRQCRDKFGPYLNRSVDWQQPKLFLRAHTVRALLIAVDRSGTFDAIPLYQESNPNVHTIVNVMSVRLKIVPPYLALMMCDLDYATIMAIKGTEPRTYDKCISEAAILKFRGPGLPLKRDLEAEDAENQHRIIEAKRREQQKFIKLEDQMAADLS